jgi:hypothetical protein
MPAPTVDQARQRVLAQDQANAAQGRLSTVLTSTKGALDMPQTVSGQGNQSLKRVLG